MESDKKHRLVLLLGAPCSLARRRLAYSLTHHRNYDNASPFITSAAKIEDIESLKTEWEDACTIDKAQPLLCSFKIKIEELKSLGLSSEQIRIVFFWSEEDTCYKAALLDKTSPETYSEAWKSYIEWAQEFLNQLKGDPQLFSRVWFADSSDDDFATQTDLMSYIMDDRESSRRPNPTTEMARVNQTLKPERKRNKGEAISILQQSKRLLDKRGEALLKQTISVLTHGSEEEQEQMLHLFYGVIAGTASWREEKTSLQRVILMRKAYWQDRYLKYCQIFCLIAMKWTEQYQANNPAPTSSNLAVVADRFEDMLDMTAKEQSNVKEYLLCGLCRIIKRAHHLYFAPEMFETDEFWRLSQMLLSTNSLMLRTYGCSLASGALRDDHLRYSFRVIEFERNLGEDNTFSFVHAIRDTIFSTMELVETFTPQTEEDNETVERYLDLFAARDVALVLQLLIDGVPPLCKDLSSEDVNKLIKYAALANKYCPPFAGNIFGIIDAILKWGARTFVADIDLRSLLENVSSCINQLVKEVPVNNRVLTVVISLFNQVLKLTQRGQIFRANGDSEEDEESEESENENEGDGTKEITHKVEDEMHIDSNSKLIDLLQSWRDLEERWKKPASARDFMSTKSLQDVYKTELDRLTKEEAVVHLAEQTQQNVELAEQLEKMTKLKEAADAEKAQLQGELARLRAEMVKPQLTSSSEVVKASTTAAVESTNQVEDQNQERDPLLDITDPIEVSPDAAQKFIDNLKQKRDSLKTLRKTICGSLRQLGPDLYSLSSHFINELIQNADDNQYSTGNTPSVLITLNEDSILFACNENGFLARDVESLCNLSVSTKTGGAHIGQKGLGFKSVFSVTNAPIIVSGPWQFCFNKTPEKDEMAYITPLWITSEQFPPELSQAVLKHQEYRTFVYLPLMKRVQTNIREFYDDVYRSLDKHVLLTLKQLKKITIIDRLNAQQTVVSCTVPSNIFSLPAGDLTVQNYQQDLHVTTASSDQKSSTTSQQFHVLKADVRVPADIVAEDKQRTAETNIMLAFPLLKNAQADTFPIFAYLPVSDIGFKFLLQCDWILVTNRESIQDKAWNRYLRDTAAEMLKWALLNHPSIYSHAWEFIPEHNPAMSRWWSLFVDNVHAVLKDERLKKLLSSDSSGHNKKEIVMPDSKVLDVVPADLIEKYSNIQLLDSAQLNSEKIKLISSYVRRLSAIDLLDCFENSAFREYAVAQSEAWWENLFKLFNGLPLTTIDKYTAKIKQAPIFLFDKTRGPINEQYCFTSSVLNVTKPWRKEFNVVYYASSSEKHFLEGQLHLTALVPQRIAELICNIHLQTAINKTTQETIVLWQDLTYIRDHVSHLTEDLIEKLKSVLLVPSSTQAVKLLSALTVPTLLATDVSKHVTSAIAYPYCSKFQSLEEDIHWEWFFLEMNAVPPVNLLSIKPSVSLELNPLANWSERAAVLGQKILAFYSDDSSMTTLIRNMLVAVNGSQLPISKVANASVFRDALPSIEVPPHASTVADMLGVCSTTTATNSLEILTAFARTNNTDIEKYTEWLWRLKSTLGDDKVDAVYASQPLVYLNDDKRFAAPKDLYLCNIDDNNRAINIVCKTLNKSLVNFNTNNNYLPFVPLLRTLGGHSFPPVSDICAALNEMAKNPKYFLPVGSEMSLLSNDGLEDFIATYQLLEMALKRSEQLKLKGTVESVEPDNPLYLHNWTWRNLHRLPGTVADSLPIPLHSKRLVHLKDTKNIRACLQDPIIKSISNSDPVPFVHPTIAINCPRTLMLLKVEFIEQISIITLGHTGANIEYQLQQVSEAFQRALGKKDITVLSVKYIPCSIGYSHLRPLSMKRFVDGNDVMSVMIKSDIPYLICDDTLVYCAVKSLQHSSRMSIIASALTNMLLRKNVTWTEEEAQKHAINALKDCTADSNVAWSKSLSNIAEAFDTEFVVFPTPAEGSLSQNFHYFADNQRVEEDASGTNQIVSFDDVLSPLAVSDPAMMERIKALDARSELFSCPHLSTDERPYMFTPQDAKRIGDAAEKFFCAYLASKYGQAFNPYVSWVSGSRTSVYPNSTSNINERAGYDFVLIDTLHLFTQDRSQNKKAKKCYFEVKGCSKDWNGQIEISRNQLTQRKRIAEVEQDTSVYFVAVVYHVDSPELTNVFVIDWSNEDTFDAQPSSYLATYNPPSHNTRHERNDRGGRSDQSTRGDRSEYNTNNRYERRDQSNRGGRSGYNSNRQHNHDNNQYNSRDRNNKQRYVQDHNTTEGTYVEQPQQQQYVQYAQPQAQYYPSAQNSYYNPNFPPQAYVQPTAYYDPNYGYANYSAQPVVQHGTPVVEQQQQPVQYTPLRGQQRNNRGNAGQRNNNEQQSNYKRQKTTHPDNSNVKDGDSQYRRK